MIGEELTDICNFTTLFFVILKSSEWLESSIKSDLGVKGRAFTWPFTILLSSNSLSGIRVLSKKGTLLIFVIWQNEILISLICDLLFFQLVNCVRDPHVRPSM